MAEKKIIKNQESYIVDDWLKDSDFTGWLVKVKEDKTKARSSVCHKTIELSTSGRSALTDHAKGKKHTEVIDRRKNFFKPKPSTSTTAGTSKSSKSDATTDLTSKKRWLVYIGQYSFSNKLDQLWGYMDFEMCYERCFSSIWRWYRGDLQCCFQISTSKISLNRTKSMYVINHGLAPFFQTPLIDALGKFEIHVYNFDESLNDSIQTSEMDLYIRYWDDLDKLLKVRYYGSSFLGSL